VPLILVPALPIEILRVVPHLVREAEDPQPLRCPVHEPPVHRVQIPVDHHRPVVREHLLPHPPDLVVHRPVLPPIHILPVARPGPPRNPPPRFVVPLPRRDVRVRHDDRPDRPRLRVRERERPRPELHVVRLPVRRPVPVHVVAARAILVDLPVAVV